LNYKIGFVSTHEHDMGIGITPCSLDSRDYTIGCIANDNFSSIGCDFPA
jgi:hypothetical protein